MATLRRPAPAPHAVDAARRWHITAWFGIPAIEGPVPDAYAGLKRLRGEVAALDVEDRMAAIDAYLADHGLTDSFERFVAHMTAGEERRRA